LNPSSSAVDMPKEWAELSKHDLKELITAMAERLAEYRKSFLDNSLELRELMHRHASSGIQLERAPSTEDVGYMARQLAVACTHNALSVSPGHLVRPAFVHAEAPIRLPRRAYEDVSSLHQQLYEDLATWASPRPVPMPPLLSLLLSQSKRRDDLLKNLVDLRHRYADLRKALRQIDEDLSSGRSLKSQLRAVRRLETLRTKVMEKASTNASTTLIRRTWSVVKKGSVLAAMAELADVLLEWGDDRRVLGGLRRFIDIERQAMEAEFSGASLSRLFGEVARA
jgi:hypothetical protein